MKKLILLGCLFLNGCYQSVSSWDIERATEKCGSLEMIVEIHAFFEGHERVICKSNSLAVSL